MQQILVLSIKEFYRVSADVADEISKLEEPSENHNIIIEKVGDNIRVNITETPDMEEMIAKQCRKSVLERIEDEHDLNAYEEAMEEYRKNPVTYSLEEVEKELE